MPRSTSLITAVIISFLGACAPVDIAPKQTAPMVEPDDPAVLRALQHIDEHGWRANIDSLSEDFAARRVFFGAGTEHVHFDRYFEGLEVVGGDFIVHATQSDFERFTLTGIQNPRARVPVGRLAPSGRM